jgi:Uma2 family endonuclease
MEESSRKEKTTSSATTLRLTPQEYLAFERKSPTRNEYHDGSIFAMAGASREHNLIAENLSWEVGNQILDRPCGSYSSEMRVWIETTGLYTYPDFVVVCGEPMFQDREGYPAQSHRHRRDSLNLDRGIRPRHQVRSLPPHPLAP